jgi:protein-tyrosine phosphatase
MKILFVCTGNICRSPIAEKMLQHYSDRGNLSLDVSSAGSRALNGHVMHPESQRVLASGGFPTSPFESRMLTPSIATEADLVLGMTRDHRAFTRQLAPARWKRMYALREMRSASGAVDTPGNRRAPSPTDAALDIEDPLGKSKQTFDLVAGQIHESILELIQWIAEHRQTENADVRQIPRS